MREFSGSTGIRKESAISRAEEVAEICRGFRAGERDATGTVQGWIRKVVFGGNWRFADPDGVCGDVLLALVRATRSESMRDAGGFEKFVYTVAKRVCVDLYHKARRRSAHETPKHPEIDPPSGDADPEQRLEEIERYQHMLYIFQKLPAQCRTLWDLVYVQALRSAAVAEATGLSPANVRVRVHRCLEKAKRIFQNYEKMTS